MSLWTTLGKSTDLATLIDFNGFWGLADSFLSSTVLYYWNDSTEGPKYLVYFGDLFSLVMCFVGAAYVVVKSVEAGVSFGEGFYSIYGAKTIFSQLLGLYEVMVIVLWQIWSLVVTLLGIGSAAYVWTLMD